MNRTHHHDKVDNIVIYHCIRIIYHCPNVIIIFVIHVHNAIIGISSMIVLVNVVQMGVIVMSTAVVIVITSIFLIVIATIVLVLQMGEIVEERPAVDNCQPGLTSRYHRHFPNAIFIGIIVKDNLDLIIIFTTCHVSLRSLAYSLSVRTSSPRTFSLCSRFLLLKREKSERPHYLLSSSLVLQKYSSFPSPLLHSPP